MGARAYHKIEHVTFNAGEIAVEIGAERGEGSTAYLTEYCAERGIPFYSVDIAPQLPQTIKMDGAEWLRNNKETIKFAYLDNFDYIFDEIANEPWLLDQVKQYADMGIDMNNDNSKAAHLEQAQLVHRNSTAGTVILIDDTWLQGGYNGKGGTAVPWLLDNGWELLEPVGWQTKSYALLRKRT